MLAFMPRSCPLLDSHISNSMVESRMSVTLLPSTPMSYSQAPLPAVLPLSPSPSKKPKLSLNTSNVSPVFGKGATSLRLETLSATSPTARNTFRNRQAREQNIGATSQKPVLTPLTTSVEVTPTDSPSPSQISLLDSADTTDLSRSPTASVTSVSTVDSSPSEAPYKLPFNATSILTNGPIPRTKNRRFSFSQSRPMFPAPKKVGFRAPLTEDIKTSKYTLKHSDIASPSPSMSTLESSPSKEDKDSDELSKAGAAEATISSPVSGLKRDADNVEDDSDIHLATPVAGRAKRHRWIWTLPPIHPASHEQPPSVDSIREAIAE